jgi:type III pantothenate kinase
VKEDQVTVVATGGLGAIFCDASLVIDTYDPILTLKGLVIIFERQQV